VPRSHASYSKSSGYGSAKSSGYGSASGWSSHLVTGGVGGEVLIMGEICGITLYT